MKIYKQLSLIMAEIGSVAKTRTNPQQGYQFRGIDDFLLAAQPILAKHGVVFSIEVINQSREERATQKGGVLTYTILTIKYTFFADDGSSLVSTVVGEAMDSGDKSCNKAMSAALKYLLLQTFCVPTEEIKDTEFDDPAPAPKTAKPPQIKQPPPEAASKFTGSSITEIVECCGNKMMVSKFDPNVLWCKVCNRKQKIK